MTRRRSLLLTKSGECYWKSFEEIYPELTKEGQPFLPLPLGHSTETNLYVLTNVELNFEKITPQENPFPFSFLEELEGDLLLVFGWQEAGKTVVGDLNFEDLRQMGILPIINQNWRQSIDDMQWLATQEGLRPLLQVV